MRAPASFSTLATTFVGLLALLAPEIARADTFKSDFGDQPDRRWVGPDFQASRFQDWTVRGGWLTCVESLAKYPHRTCALLTPEIVPDLGSFRLRVEVRPANDGERLHAERAGVLFGIGSPAVEPAIRALVQGVPAADGGILAVIDERGRAAFRDFSKRPDRVGFWSIDGALPEDACPILQPKNRTGTGRDDPGVLLLELETHPLPNGRYDVVLRAIEPDATEISRAELKNVDRSLLVGSLSLVSHRGPGGEGHAFRKLELTGPSVKLFPERSVGPVLGVLYTIDRGTWKLTAQLPPLGKDDPSQATLQIVGADGKWQTVATAERQTASNTCHFRVVSFRPSETVNFRVVASLAKRGGGVTDYAYVGSVPVEPTPGDSVTVAMISCVKNYTGDLAWNGSRIWFPHTEVATAIESVRPDLFLATGDQIYEGDLSGAVRSPDSAMFLDYQTKWARWLRSFGSVTRHTPTVVLPDDHDVYHGNLWGAANLPGLSSRKMSGQDAGGYRLSPDLVNAIHTTQVGHLPDPIDPTPLSGGITPYFTRLEYGGLSLALIDDRMWKSAPAIVLPEAEIVNGWAKNPDFDWVKQGDPPNAQLLGAPQEEFLEEWAVDYAHDARLKVLVSQSVFANVATLPPPANSDAVVPSLPVPRADEYPEGEIPVADADSNGWPVTPRNRAVEALRRGSAIHLTGDQHLASVIQYGVEKPGDAGFAFGGPAVANTWPRRWFPSVAGRDRLRGAPRYTGDFFDGFGNPMRVYAVANPVVTGRSPARLYDRVPGFAVVEFGGDTQRLTLECWPRGVDPRPRKSRRDEAPTQYLGWPISLVGSELDGRSRLAWGHLGPITSPAEAPIPWVVRVRREPTGEILSARRLAAGETILPAVDAPGVYTVEIGDGTGAWQIRRGQRPIPQNRR